MRILNFALGTTLACALSCHASSATSSGMQPVTANSAVNPKESVIQTPEQTGNRDNGTAKNRAAAPGGKGRSAFRADPAGDDSTSRDRRAIQFNRYFSGPRRGPMLLLCIIFVLYKMLRGASRFSGRYVAMTQRSNDMHVDVPLTFIERVRNFSLNVSNADRQSYQRESPAADMRAPNVGMSRARSLVEDSNALHGGGSKPGIETVS